MSSHDQRTSVPILPAVEDDLLGAVIRFAHAVRQRTRSVIAVVMFAVVLGGVHCAWRMQAPVVYETTAEVAVVTYAPELRGIHRFLVTADPVLKATVDQLPETLREQWKTLSRDQQIARIRGGLTASFRHGTSNVLQLSYRSAHPETGTTVLNAVIAVYTDFIASHVIGRQRLLALSRPPPPGSVRPDGLEAYEYYLQPIRLPSVPSQPVPFRWWRILSAWTFGGLLIGLGQVFVRETIDRIGNRAESPAETATDHPVPSSRAA